MSKSEIGLLAHLMRNAAFGETEPQLLNRSNNSYDQNLDSLLNPGEPDVMPQDIILRMNGSLDEGPGTGASDWMYRMVTTKNPLEEKLTLFFHGLFAVNYSVGNQARTQLNQIDTFRRFAFGSFKDLLLELSRDPAMIFFLNNNENVQGNVNENYGRELLELFAMGIGNYNEEDVKECSRAFTGWTIYNMEYMRVKAVKDSFSPFGRIAWHFEYRDHEHDHGDKTFLGEKGKFNGEDIIDIIARQPATARFICQRLFQFFAADKIEKEGANVISSMVRSYYENGYEIRSVMRTLFASDYFKSLALVNCRVRNPVELVVGALRISGSVSTPTPNVTAKLDTANFMGQGLLRPPSVEGWHEAEEWIDSGALVERVNFVAKEFRDHSQPGIKVLLDTFIGNKQKITPEELIDRCANLLGFINLESETKESLTKHIERKCTDLNIHSKEIDITQLPEESIAELFSLISITPEYQMA